MNKAKIVNFFFIIVFIIIGYFGYLNIIKKKVSDNRSSLSLEENSFTSSTMRDVNYISNDTKGNEYKINALTGEIDIGNSNIIYLTNVKAEINLNDSNKVIITSDFGKYNTANFDTIFSKNVIIKYLDNKITGEYLDFSLERNLMVISRDIVYTNSDNILIADVLEMNIKTKDTKIFMYEDKKSVKIKSKN